jgi:hypothetical protein
MQFFDQTVKFLQFLVIQTMDPELDPDPLLQKILYQEPDPQLEKCWIRIRIKLIRYGTYPKLWFKGTVSRDLHHGLLPPFKSIRHLHYIVIFAPLPVANKHKFTIADNTNPDFTRTNSTLDYNYPVTLVKEKKVDNSVRNKGL